MPYVISLSTKYPDNCSATREGHDPSSVDPRNISNGGYTGLSKYSEFKQGGREEERKRGRGEERRGENKKRGRGSRTYKHLEQLRTDTADTAQLVKSLGNGLGLRHTVVVEYAESKSILEHSRGEQGDFELRRVYLLEMNDGIRYFVNLNGKGGCWKLVESVSDPGFRRTDPRKVNKTKITLHSVPRSRDAPETVCRMKTQ
ncbi:hypothetical protein GLAREA_12258 [Glarea lozoyensis ATCC 20868]|uniref:Uncharacterized protein n=1 Tax=Glarea lozoyensis (strain ATCC 20868 / MF5171) TaxID=1116229 RepID=S3CYZ4_GLAL2|nr:uncharacterized protein GLAREA_12258 [Glarea lozoyensis ATCC 20868]EPE31502.1 hypothetical protein GLAREA_12258 [Glarea lozoyensis ATCC 20868]